MTLHDIKGIHLRHYRNFTSPLRPDGQSSDKAADQRALYFIRVLTLDHKMKKKSNGERTKKKKKKREREKRKKKRKEKRMKIKRELKG